MNGEEIHGNYGAQIQLMEFLILSISQNSLINISEPIFLE
jgi:hypothetical protein